MFFITLKRAKVFLEKYTHTHFENREKGLLCIFLGSFFFFASIETKQRAVNKKFYFIHLTDFCKTSKLISDNFCLRKKKKKKKKKKKVL